MRRGRARRDVQPPADFDAILAFVVELADAGDRSRMAVEVHGQRIDGERRRAAAADQRAAGSNCGRCADCIAAPGLATDEEARGCDAGAGSVGSDVTFVPGSTTAADSFTVAGDANRSYSIATTGGNVTSGGTSLAFTTTPSAATGTLSTSGTGSFTVGGTLTVTGTAPTGAYTGTYSATVAYN